MGQIEVKILQRYLAKKTNFHALIPPPQFGMKTGRFEMPIRSLYNTAYFSFEKFATSFLRRPLCFHTEIRCASTIDNPFHFHGMPQSRDRRSKPVDIAAIFHRRRSGVIGILDDELESTLFRSTPSRVNTVGTASGQATGLGVMRAGGIVRGSLGTPRNGFRTMDRHSPSGTARRGRIRPTRSVLPSWYPRTPLRDITAVVRAMERRSVRSGENQGQQLASPLRADQSPLDPSLSVSAFPLEQCISANSPNPAVGLKLRTPTSNKLPKILLDITNQSVEGLEFLTPQKKLLNSIDMVEKVVREELQKLKRTPNAKKADREKRVRTLMSMR